MRMRDRRVAEGTVEVYDYLLDSSTLSPTVHPSVSIYQTRLSALLRLRLRPFSYS